MNYNYFFVKLIITREETSSLCLRLLLVLLTEGVVLFP